MSRLPIIRTSPWRRRFRNHGVSEVRDLAERRWREYQGPRVFRAERAAFVQNTVANCWLDLAEYSLGAVPVR